LISKNIPNIRPWASHEDWWLRESAFMALMGLQDDEALFTKYLPALTAIMAKEYNYNPHFQMIQQLRKAAEKWKNDRREGALDPPRVSHAFTSRWAARAEIPRQPRHAPPAIGEQGQALAPGPRQLRCFGQEAQGGLDGRRAGDMATEEKGSRACPAGHGWHGRDKARRHGHAPQVQVRLVPHPQGGLEGAEVVQQQPVAGGYQADASCVLQAPGGHLGEGRV